MTASTTATAASATAPGTDVSSVVVTDHLSKWYGQVIGLNDVSLTIGRGVTGLLGPNGAGKSTLLKLITGQLKASKGSLTVLDQPVWGGAETSSSGSRSCWWVRMRSTVR